jgi:predicted HAD superfamily Cof-like phosphohydrolase
MIGIHFEKVIVPEIRGFWEWAETVSLMGHEVMVFSDTGDQNAMLAFMFSDRKRWLDEGNVSRSVEATKMHFSNSIDPPEVSIKIDNYDVAQLMFDCVMTAPNLFADVTMFHVKFGQGYDGPPRTWPDGGVEEDQFRIKFMREEVDEYEHHQTLLTHGAEHIPTGRRTADAGRLDAVADIVFVALGTAYKHGWDFYEAWRRVVRANMRKELASGVGDDVGKWKIRKPVGWIAPDHTDLV